MVPNESTTNGQHEPPTDRTATDSDARPRARAGEPTGSDGTPPVWRRTLLGAVGTVVGAGLTGCVGGSAAGRTATTAATTPSPERSLALPSVVTRGDFPDGRVTLRPPGTVTFLNFFATWCKPCQEEMPDLRRLRAEYDPDALHMVSITPEVDEGLIREFWSTYDGTWPVVRDPALAATERWDANRYPTNLLFDRDGDPATGNGPAVGARGFEELKALVDPLVGGR